MNPLIMKNLNCPHLIFRQGYVVFKCQDHFSFRLFFPSFPSTQHKQVIAEKWRESTLIQLRKGRGRPGNLEEMRHIHIHNEYLSFFSQIVMFYSKDILLQNMSKFQIAQWSGYFNEPLILLHGVQFRLLSISNFSMQGTNSVDMIARSRSDFLLSSLGSLLSNCVKGLFTTLSVACISFRPIPTYLSSKAIKIDVMIQYAMYYSTPH